MVGAAHMKRGWCVSARGVAFVILSVLLLVCATAMCFWRLGEGAVWNADESRHAVNAYEMLRSGDLIVSTYNGEVDYWNLKPPLSMWAIMVSYLAFGFNAFALRLPSALSYLATVVLIWLFLWKRWGRVAAVCGGALSLTCTYVWGNHLARAGDPDALYLLLFTGAMMCLMLAEDDHRWVYPSGLLCSLAFLAKASHALILFPLILLCLLATRTLSRYRPREVLGFFACALFPVALWAAARFSRDGVSFFAGMLGVDVVERVSTVMGGTTGPITHYVRLLLTDFGVLASLGLAALGGLCALLLSRTSLGRRGSDALRELLGRPHDLIVLALWALLPIAAFSVIPTKHMWYVYPSLPAIFMLGGIGASVSVRACARREGPVSALAATGLVVGVVSVSLGVARCLPIVFQGAMLGRYGYNTVQDVCGDGMMQPELRAAWEAGELPYSAPVFVDYGNSTELDAEIFGVGLRQGTFAVIEWYGDGRVESGGIPAFLSHDGPATLIVTDEVRAEHADELSAFDVVASADGYQALAKWN